MQSFLTQCTFVLYPDTQQELIDYCQNNLPCAWALHDKDFWEDVEAHEMGDQQKAHVHFLCKFPRVQYVDKLAEEIGIPRSSIHMCFSLYDNFCYLWHKNHPERYQYSRDIVGMHDFTPPTKWGLK